MEPNAATMQDFLVKLFGNLMAGEIELAWSAPGEGAVNKAQLYPLDDLDALVDRAESLNKQKCNVYFGAALRRSGGRSKRNGDDGFLCAPACWVDIDDGEAVKLAKSKCGAALPNLAVITGRTPAPRAHLYWILDEATDDAIALRKQNAAIAGALGGDSSAVNVSRVMRLAGSVAWPVKAGRVPELVELQTWPNRPGSYLPQQLAKAFPREKANLLRASDFNVARPKDHWLAILRDGMCEGTSNGHGVPGRDEAATQLFGYLLRRGHELPTAAALLSAVNDARFRPPLSESELEKIVRSIGQKEAARRGVNRGH